MPPETVFLDRDGSGFAVVIMMLRMSVLVAAGFAAAIKAATPLTCGAAIEVPDSYPY
jgi:hypothetical protein